MATYYEHEMNRRLRQNARSRARDERKVPARKRLKKKVSAWAATTAFAVSAVFIGIPALFIIGGLVIFFPVGLAYLTKLLVFAL